MKSRPGALGAIGASAGLAAALVFGTGALAASHHGGKKAPPTVTSTYSCATFSGLTLTQQYVQYNGVALRTGQVVTANVSPAASGDLIMLSESLGLNLTFYEAPATAGLAFRAPYDGVYNLSWSLKAAGTTPSSLTWTFRCG